VRDTNPTQIHVTGEATGFIPAPGDQGKPITVIGTNSIRAGFDATCLQSAPGVTDLVLNFATVNPMLINQLVLEAFQEIPAHVASWCISSAITSRAVNLVSEIARFRARFVIKDSDDSLEGAA
jgi:hypothetical protein